MVLTSHMLLPPVAFMLRVHRPTIALRLRLAALMLATLMFATLLAIHGRTAKAIAAMPRALIRTAVASIGGIHGGAILRRIHRSTLPIARACHVRAALRLTHVVRTGSIAVPLLARTRQVTWRSGRRSVHFGNCGRKWRSVRRLVCRLGVLGLQRRDAESERTTKPGKSVGFGFHVRVLFRLTAEEQTPSIARVSLKMRFISLRFSNAAEETRIVDKSCIIPPQLWRIVL